ncbi:asparaginase [Virgibacillus sp. NKC19-16]|uniref:asparaginase n=1 Tax=Virgibacillus salidurans TaxID=2831673 RepID=UPI001F177142|nr:asparaginase [Virgibacillus sp. NKC19-16]UJL45690.1 asparaginase [Virgibacillus sp. NKC19-16]
MNSIANVYRSGVIENSHLGHIAVVDEKGRLLYSYGDPYRLTYARSCMKPVQAVPLIESGAADDFRFDQADISLACSSHNSEEHHLARVLSMLEKTGQNESVLQCGFHHSLNQDVQETLIKKEITPTSVYSACSGKHAGMIATAVQMDADLDTYLDPANPLQKRILHTIEEMTDYPAEKMHIGIDGCGAPVHRLPLYNLALSYARLANPDVVADPKRQTTLERIADAMVDFPEMVGGKDRYCTDIMRAFEGRIVGKLGADAVYCVGDRKTGLGIAVKIEDGNLSLLYPVVNEILRQLNIGEEKELHQLKQYTNPDVLNTNDHIVGKIKAEFQLAALS